MTAPRKTARVPKTFQPIKANHTPPAPIPAEGFMRLPAVLSVIPVSRVTWLNGCKSGRFPKPVKLGPKMVAWKVQDIRSLIASFDTAANDQNGGQQ